MAELSEDLRSALADRYRLENEIGRGGMAVVYRAHDLRHDRRVAIKVLLPELASAVMAERFLQEIRLTASFAHPHILPLLDSGKADGLVYYVMPYVEGESLRQKLEREGRLPVNEATRIAREVADALGYAHGQGVLHRDVKPENILLQAGHAVVADFGIARAVKEAAGEGLTDTGVSIGTPAYMSPEQAAGDAVDERSDLYSLACVLYEMLCGQVPYAGASPLDILARKVAGELRPIGELRSEVDRDLEAVLNRALSAGPEARFATTGEFAGALEAAARPAGPTIGLRRALAMYAGLSAAVLVLAQLLLRWLDVPGWLLPGAVAALLICLPIVVATALVQRAPAPGARGLTPGRAAARRWLTWRSAGLTLVGSFALLGVAVSGYSGMRLMGVGPMGTLFAKGVLQEHDRIVLAEFTDQAGDSLLAMAITTAFRTDLEQSGVVNVADRDFVADALARMKVDAETPLDYELARQIALREGLKAVVSGEVTAVGTGYLISARLSAAEGGELLWSAREGAADATLATLLPATERLSRKLRSRIGESLADVRASPPLARVTTSSLEALEKYSQAARYPYVPGKLERMIEPLEEAVALDSTFAAAWLLLGWAQQQWPYPKSEYVHSFTRAWELRDRVSERERSFIEYVYNWHVTGDEERIAAALRARLEWDPDDVGALNDLGLLHSHWRQYEEAESLLRRCVEVDSLHSTIPYFLLAQAQAAQGKWEATDTTLRRGSQVHGPDAFLTWRLRLEASRGNYDAAEALLDQLSDEPGLSGRRAGLARGWRAILATLRGRLGEADRLQAEARLGSQGGVAVLTAAWWAGRELKWRADTTGALQIMEEALERWPLDSLPVLDRHYPQLVEVYAATGKPERAREYLLAYETNTEQEDPEFHGTRYRARGYIALAEGRAADAISEFRLVDDEMYMELARAYEMAGQPDSAIAFYERFVNRFGFRLLGDSDNLGHAYERLAQLYEREGMADRSVYYYGKLITLWQDADAELQPRVEAARRAVRALSPDR